MKTRTTPTHSRGHIIKGLRRILLAGGIASHLLLGSCAGLHWADAPHGCERERSRGHDDSGGLLGSILSAIFLGED